MVTVASPVEGTLVALDDVADDVFAKRMMGDGIAIQPTGDTVRAPVAGRIAKLFPGGHAFAVSTPDGVDVLVHLGLDTSGRKGDGFHVDVAEGDQVTVGQDMETMELSRLRDEGVDMTTVVIVISGQEPNLDRTDGEVEIGDALFTVPA